MKRNARSLATLCGLVWVLAACAGVDSGDEWVGSTEILPNGVVRVTNPAAGLWAQSEPWRLIPEFVIGEMDGDDATVFGSISAIEVDSAGHILVLDRQANELRIFGPNGEHIRSVGRSGEGPGEYANANGLAWMSDDSLLVIDQRGNRYSVLTLDGDYVRSVPRALGFFGWVFTGGYHDGRIYEISSVTRGEDRYPALLGTRIAGVSTDAAGAIEAAEGDPQPPLAAAGDTVMLPNPDAPLYESFSIRTERGGMVMGVPFTARPVYYLDRSGSLWHGHGSANRIYRSTFAGDTLSEILLAGNPFPVTPEEIADWEAGPAVEQFRTLGGKLELERIPKEKAFFDDMVADDDGVVWLTVPAGPNETVFSVLDPDGRYLGRLQVDGMARESYIRPVARHDRLYWVGRDELDVQRVYVYRIEK